MSKDDRRVIVHVGVPKSGTTFLRTSLAENRRALRAAGVLYPAGPPEPMLRAALDVRGNHKAWGRRRRDVAGTWAELCHKARRHAGTTVISHELLAAASARRAGQALAELKGLDVHVVVTARDVARQVIAQWQEGAEHGRTVSFRQFAERVSSYDPAHKQAKRFWSAQELPGVLARWGATLPSDHVHLVCCPPRPAPTEDLWRLFAGVVGFDPARFPASAPGDDTSLGTTQTALLRHVNAALGDRLPQPAYGRAVTQGLAHGLLTRHPSPRPALPRPLHAALADMSERWVKEIDRVGYQVHGDLRDLVPAAPAWDAPHPDDVDDRAEADTAAAVIADLLVELARCRAGR